jgi:dihydrofolate synthase/folylpolyglutamate synthase
MAAAALTRAGFRVGVYTSPHLVDVRERMMVDDRPIPRDAFVAWVRRLREEILRTDASFFEATTAVAFADFAARGVDIAVIEVGLGGRLDSTNVIRPLVSCVTAVGLDHTDYLGDSLAQIAREKAGIAKPATPFVIGETNQETVAVLRDVAEAVGSQVTVVDPRDTYDGPLAMCGRHQRRNAMVAIALLQALPPPFRPDRAAIEQGLAAAWLPGRFDRRGPWLFDVAHNAAAMETLVSCVRDERPPRPIQALVGMLRDKDWTAALGTLRPAVDAMWVSTAPSAEPDRRPDLRRVARTAGVDVAIEPDFDRALRAAAAGARTVLVTGSFHTVGDSMKRLPGFAPLG